MGLQSSLSSWYSCESTGNQTDNTPNALTLTATNTVTGTTGKVANGVSFSGTSYLGRDSASAHVMSGNVPFSISFWCNFASFASAQAAVWKGNVVFALTDYEYRVNTGVGAGGASFRFAVTDSSSQGILDATGTTMSTGTWYHICAVYTGAVLGLYTNAGAGETTPYTNGSWDSTIGLGVGASKSGSSKMTNGSMLDEVAIWKNYALTAADRTALYNGGAGLSYAQFLPSGLSTGMLLLRVGL